MDLKTVALEFVKHYYNAFNTNRGFLKNLYMNESCLAFEGQEFVGAAQIAAKLESFRFQVVEHIVTTVDVQTHGNFVLIAVHGQRKTDDDPPHSFFHAFCLTQTSTGHVMVLSEIFRRLCCPTRRSFKIAVIGCGPMGTKIAGCMAYHGHRVKIWDTNRAALAAVQTNLEVDKYELHSGGLMTHPNFLGQVLCMRRLDETVEDAEFIFEAIIEDLETKKNLFEKMTQMCKPDAIIGSNSLQCNIEDIVEKANCKERIMNFRFFHPVYATPKVQITTTKHTSPENVEKVRQLLEMMGKTLYFRSGKEPLIHSNIQVSSTKFAMSNNRDCAVCCAVCMDRKRDCLLCPCHHLVTCHECAKSLINRQDRCPICRKEIREIIKVFTA